MRKKIITIILSIVLIIVLAFGAIAYFLNRPGSVLAGAFIANGRTSAINGDVDIKISFDTSKFLGLPEISDNPFAAGQIEIIKNTLESSNIKLTFDALADSTSKLLLNGNIILPEALGQSIEFKFFMDGTDAWSKLGNEAWVKAESGSSSAPLDRQKLNEKAILDFINTCPINVNGDIITLTMKPKFDDIKKILPKETLDEINANTKDVVSFENVINALNLQMTVTVNKNSLFFIPRPYVSRVTMEMNGDLSKIAPSVTNISDEEKAMLEGIGFSANGTVNNEIKDGITVQRPVDLK